MNGQCLCQIGLLLATPYKYIKNMEKSVHNLSEKTILCVISLFFLVASCTTVSPMKVHYAPGAVMAPPGTSSLDPEEITSILRQIKERNLTIENNPKWIKRAYSGLLIRRLTNVSEKEFKDYRQYLDNGALYILVHPAYFSFFHYPKRLLDNSKDKPLSKYNVVETLLGKKPKDRKFAVMQAQERRTRDFIEFKSTEEKLIIVVVPKNYQKYPGYTYRKGLDEYMRYLNEVTNFSKSVLFVESRSPNRGYLTDEDAVRLMEFILSIAAEKVYIGGGYIGRCLEDFYALLIEDFGREGIYLVPELSDISPREVNKYLAKAILKQDGTLDKNAATQFMLKDAYNVQEVRPDIINLP